MGHVPHYPAATYKALLDQLVTAATQGDTRAIAEHVQFFQGVLDEFVALVALNELICRHQEYVERQTPDYVHLMPVLRDTQTYQRYWRMDARDPETDAKRWQDAIEER